MAMRPKPVCPVCRRRVCICSEETKAETKRRRESGWARYPSTPRPGIQSAAEKRRRREFVRRWIAEHGPLCVGYKRPPHMVNPKDLTADHVHPVALGGAEDGPLQAMCRACQNRQGSDLANARRGRGQS